VPCLRRATALAYTDADEEAELLLTFGDLSSTGNEADKWVMTHAGSPSAYNFSSAKKLEDVEWDLLTSGIGVVSSAGGPSTEPAEAPDLDDIPDMEEDFEEDDDEATAVPHRPTYETSDTAYVVGSIPSSHWHLCVPA
jgi:ubiquitin-like-conjugating enzyme ATG3